MTVGTIRTHFGVGVLVLLPFVEWCRMVAIGRCRSLGVRCEELRTCKWWASALGCILEKKKTKGISNIVLSKNKTVNAVSILRAEIMVALIFTYFARYFVTYCSCTCV